MIGPYDSYEYRIYNSWTLIRSIDLAAPEDGKAFKVKGEVQTRKGLRWMPRHPETRKGVVIDEMLRGVEKKHRSGDSRIGQPFELLLNPWAGKRQPGELKHLSSQRKIKQKRFP
ncbi:unnamed protein product [Cuscuta epithymum]|uniref:Uncharacterized protein n=1 Tax=Cuscuta epithymum TaxID=186058 RepID=A0AAV0E439_9ASTE|nr:unnamed protein product [Cuscuta epithymum]